MIHESYHSNPKELERVRKILIQQDFWMDLELLDLKANELSLIDWQQIHQNTDYLKKKSQMSNPVDLKRLMLIYVKNYLNK